MRYGFVFPGGTVHEALEMGQAAEAAGWDGFFVWDPVWGMDAWVTLAAVAMRTERIRLGTMITPVSRRRPWKLASETATLDQLSNGRLILAVGLGAVETGFVQFGEETDRKKRAELLDEGLDIITGLWAGQPFNYSGKHYNVQETTFVLPQPPVQQPRIPIWVVGAWPRPRSLQRALRYDGLLPAHIVGEGKFEPVSADVLRQIKAYVDRERTEAAPFDIVMEGETPGDDADEAAEIVGPLAAAGATWWLEAMWTAPSLNNVWARVKQGPPKVA
jgi:alkanesulfonate monooxygenase SsuD/methylene tetrahydromethanopterin reductase-like flavin-dependent oxidoreductase (luciferase family)